MANRIEDESGPDLESGPHRLIPVTQFLRPDGRRREVHFSVHDQQTYDQAMVFIADGGWFEAEVLTTNDVSLTACRIVKLDGEEQPDDIDCEIVPNGPGVPDAMRLLIARVASGGPYDDDGHR